MLSNKLTFSTLTKFFTSVNNSRSVLNAQSSCANSFSSSSCSSVARAFMNSPANYHIEKLDVLQQLAKEQKNSLPNLENCFFVSGQHILGTTASLFKWLKDDLNLKTEKTYIVGKCYSTHPDVLQAMKDLDFNMFASKLHIRLGGFDQAYDRDMHTMWNLASQKIQQTIRSGEKVEGIIVMDDGGHLFDTFPDDLYNFLIDEKNNIPVVGIEQTSSGIRDSRGFLFPNIEVASSAAKRLEAPMIAELMEKQLEKTLQELKEELEKHHASLGTAGDSYKNLRYGVVGHGRIGSAMLGALLKHGCAHVNVFDTKSVDEYEGVSVHNSLRKLVVNSDVLIGCTGQDFILKEPKGVDGFLEYVEERHQDRQFPLVLISASSKDKEFKELLKHIHANNRNGPIGPLDDVPHPKGKNGQITKLIILGGGTPFNFRMINKHQQVHSVPPEQIQLTRGLLATAVMQAYEMFDLFKERKEDKVQQYKLDPIRQQQLVDIWYRVTGRTCPLKFKDLDWFEKNSDGVLFKPMRMRPLNLTEQSEPCNQEHRHILR